jgi:formate hydrogenlyase transcriptional activator
MNAQPFHIADTRQFETSAPFAVGPVLAHEAAARGRVPLADLRPDEFVREGIVGRSAAIRDVIDQIRLVAPTDATVLIGGETGTGKELIARAVHTMSARRSHAFVKCNCASMPTGLLESELFGHEKGSFTGAVAQRIGRFELANHGTIFLDEIGETPLEVQPKLLRVLQEREFERVGNSHTQRTGARVVAATNVKLTRMVGSKRFRADLYYRLNVFPIYVPPLRERPEDIPGLVRYFAREAARRMNRKVTWIAPTAMDALVAHPWPGNIRELQNFVERSVIRSAGDELRVPVSELDRGIGALERPVADGTLEEVERAHIVAALKATRWMLSGPRGAARRLGMHRSTLQFRMKKLGIERPDLGATSE